MRVPARGPACAGWPPALGFSESATRTQNQVTETPGASTDPGRVNSAPTMREAPSTALGVPARGPRSTHTLTPSLQPPSPLWREAASGVLGAQGLYPGPVSAGWRGRLQEQVAQLRPEPAQLGGNLAALVSHIPVWTSSHVLWTCVI